MPLSLLTICMVNNNLPTGMLQKQARVLLTLGHVCL